MKRIIAIAFLSLQIFSVCGHILLYQYTLYRTDKLFNDRIGENIYNINDLVEIKVPLHTAVNQSWNNFEPISGQIQFKSTCYNYVKLKLAKDTVYLVCIPNYEKTKLFNQNVINAKNVPDIPVNKKDHVPFGKTNNPGSYNFALNLYKFVPHTVSIPPHNTDYLLSPVTRFIAIPEQPPKC